MMKPSAGQKSRLKTWLDRLYADFTLRRYVSPDPLELLYAYPEIRDREIAGLVAACLAYGRAELIVKNARWALDRMGPSPFEYLVERREKDIQHDFSGFKYRFATADHLVHLLLGVRRTLDRFGSLNQCFYRAMDQDAAPQAGLDRFAAQLTQGGLCPGHLVARPNRGSACKRLWLYLRWMVRKDGVDPGGWEDVSPGKLVVPLDTHMHRVGMALGFTRRKQANMRTALEITRGFAEIRPKDPVRYDFALTRPGIWKTAGKRLPADLSCLL